MRRWYGRYLPFRPHTGFLTVFLKKIEFPWPIPDIILQHRERFNGSGFPQGIKGMDILIQAFFLLH
jgi:HD-GYP domain-containing protein (c-di-GMP phosphodiesterase class II)